ncbi:MAG: hypothetical protein ABEI31_02745 [Halodesulfurarchaeum sp.]
MTTGTHEVVHIGAYVIYGFILLPVYLMILGWLVGKPRDYRRVALAFVYLFAWLMVVVLGLLFLDIGLSWIQSV